MIRYKMKRINLLVDAFIVLYYVVKNMSLINVNVLCSAH